MNFPVSACGKWSFSFPVLQFYRDSDEWCSVLKCLPPKQNISRHTECRCEVIYGLTSGGIPEGEYLRARQLAIIGQLVNTTIFYLNLYLFNLYIIDEHHSCKLCPGVYALLDGDHDRGYLRLIKSSTISYDVWSPKYGYAPLEIQLVLWPPPYLEFKCRKVHYFHRVLMVSLMTSWNIVIRANIMLLWKCLWKCWKVSVE